MGDEKGKLARVGNRFKDLSGMKFNRLLAISHIKERKHHRIVWKCKCDCGNISFVQSTNLTSGHIKSCGCKNIDHGHTVGKTCTPTWKSWKSMRERCNCKTGRSWIYYGSKGTTVCKEWNKYENFLRDMGERPVGTSIDRINTFGNYEPGNCRWATSIQQANNQRRHYALEAFK
jgi:hypothetical protein